MSSERGMACMAQHSTVSLHRDCSVLVFAFAMSVIAICHHTNAYTHRQRESCCFGPVGDCITCCYRFVFILAARTHALKQSRNTRRQESGATAKNSEYKRKRRRKKKQEKLNGCECASPTKNEWVDDVNDVNDAKKKTTTAKKK